MLKAKVAVLVSGGGTNLQALINACSDGRIKSAEIALVVSNNKSAYALERAKNAGIESVYIPSNEHFESALEEKLEEHGIDLIVLAGFMRILSASFSERYDKKIINIHPSLIPSFCGKGFYGLKVHEAVLSYGVKITGATVHFVNAIPDGGDIILQKAVEVKEGDTPEILQRRVMEEAEWKILPEAVELVASEIIRKG